MVLGYNAKWIEQLSYDFYNATGINFMMFDDNYTPLNYQFRNIYKNFNPYCFMIQSSIDGKQACLCCDKALCEKCKETGLPQMHVCHAGLIDVVLPITHENKIVGYITFGQFKNTEDFSLVKNQLPFDVPDKDKLEALYQKLPLFTNDKINSFTNLMGILAKHMLSDDVITLKNSEIIERIVTYIDDNLDKKLSIEDITSALSISQSFLYSIFHAYFGSTVSEYINQKKVYISKDLLANTDLSLEIISELLGFSSASYFSKTFKKICGVSPLKFRQSQKNYTAFYLSSQKAAAMLQNRK